MKYKTAFYSKVIREHPKTETASLIKEKPDCEYYELCQSFLDVALNAPIIKNADGSLAGIFQHSDIDIAKRKAVSFITAHNIQNIDEFFAILDAQYPFSALPDDKRQKSALVRENCNNFGYIGTWYSFTHISDDVYHGIANEIKEMLGNKH